MLEGLGRDRKPDVSVIMYELAVGCLLLKLINGSSVGSTAGIVVESAVVVIMYEWVVGCVFLKLISGSSVGSIVEIIVGSAVVVK